MSPSLQTNLVAPTSSFVGREGELETLTALFEEGRVVTLLGPGGMGKTRLAMRYCEGRLAQYAEQGGGVWFVDLSAATDSSSVGASVAAVLGVELSGLKTDGAIGDAIGRRLAMLGRVLLLLDNVEQVVGGAAPLVERWAQMARSARFLVTSRTVLGVESEYTLTLGPLSPVAAAQLFVERARLVEPEREQPDDATVSGIVESIDRMPLAIELAASRTRVLSASDLQVRLLQPLEILRGGDTGRHSSVRGAVLDSVELLTLAEQRLFALASSLRNGFTLADAEAVLGEVALPRAEVLDGLEALVRTSLLRVRTDRPGPARYAFFETIRDVAEEIAARDPALQSALEAHSRYFAARSSTATDEDLDNVLLAHSTALRFAEGDKRDDGAAAGDKWDDGAAVAVSIALGLESLLSSRGLSRLRAKLFDDTLAALGTNDTHDRAERARLRLGRGLARRELGETTPAQRDFEAALSLATEAGLEGLCAVALAQLGGILDVAGDTAAARSHFVRALALLANTTDDELRSGREADTLLLLGHAHRREGTLDEARQALTEAVRRFAKLENDEGLASTHYELAVVAIFAGDKDEATRTLDEGLAAAKRGNARVMEGTLAMARACLLQEDGDLTAALELHAEASRIFREVGSRYREASALFYLATTYIERGEPAEALAILAQARRCAMNVGAPRYEVLMKAGAATALGLLGRLEEAEVELAGAEAALGHVPNEPSLSAALAVHRILFDLQAGHRDAQGAETEADSRVRASPNDDARFALRILRQVVGGGVDSRSNDALIVWSQGAGFVLPGSSEGIALPTGSPLRRILELLVDRRLEARGEVVAIDEVIGAGWPGEKIGSDAALNRAYVAVATLRRKGLRDLLMSTAGGYALSQAVVVRLREAD